MNARKKKIKSKPVLSQKNIILAVTASIVLIVLFVFLQISNSSLKAERKEALNLAEAGLSRAIWYLNTTKIQGGKGLKWRTDGFEEKVDPGKYIVVIEDGDVNDEVLVTSTGSVGASSRIIKQILVQNQFPPAFDYAIFSNSLIKIENKGHVYGDIYGRGNISINFPSKVENGYVYACRGHIVSGSGDYKVGGSGTILYIPMADFTFYDSEIIMAKDDVIGYQGDRNYSDLDLQTDIYVDGNVNISGHISGDGSIIAAKSIKIKNGAVKGRPRFIAGENIEVEDISSSDKNTIFYANKDITIKGDADLKGSLIVKHGRLLSDGDVSIYGSIYCSGNKTEIKKKARIYGSIVTSRIDTIQDDVVITHDPAHLPDIPPPGLAAKIFNIKENSRQEL